MLDLDEVVKMLYRTAAQSGNFNSALVYVLESVFEAGRISGVRQVVPPSLFPSPPGDPT